MPRLRVFRPKYRCFWLATVCPGVSAMSGWLGILMTIGTLMLCMMLRTEATELRGSAAAWPL